MEFNPSRWIDDKGNFKTEDREKIITFGTGKRVCLGKALARMEVFLFLVKLIRKYTLGVPEGDELPSCETVMNRASISMKEFRLKVVPRKC